MKKFLTIVLMLGFSLMASAEASSLSGVWENGKVELTFQNDSLLIDEIDNEGFGYTFTYDSKTNLVTAVSIFGDITSIKIVKLTKDTLSLYFTDDEKKEIHTFHRKQNQVPTLGF